MVKEPEVLLERALAEISKLVEIDPKGEKFPELWKLHTDIHEYLDWLQS